MATEIIEIQAQALAVGDLFDTRCGVADLAFAVITDLRRVEYPGCRDRIEITFRHPGGLFPDERTTRELPADHPVRVKVEVPDAAESPARPALVLPKPMDHQRKAPHRSARKPGTVIQRAMLAYRNRRVLTAAGYLASLGADSDTIRRYASAFGRKAAQAYRSETGQEPTQSGWAIARHRLIRVFAYDQADAEILRQAVASYPKTSQLLTIGS